MYGGQDVFEELDFVGGLHKSASRDYRGRVMNADKAECAVIAKQYGKAYWDGPRQFGYGGYRYDGRWRAVADQMASHYALESSMKILDVGCGKAHLLYEFTQAVPGIEVRGVDISEYGLLHAKDEVKPYLQSASADKLPFEDSSFDLVFSINTLHNLEIAPLYSALQEIVRVSRNSAGYIVVESYRTEREKVNLLYWQLTCESFYSPQEWIWIYKENGYTGDFGFIYFE
jgi:SAM-dependent methyltransferase